MNKCIKTSALCIFLCTSSILISCSGMDDFSMGGMVSAGQDLYQAATVSDEELHAVALQFAQYSDSNNRVASSSSNYAKRIKRLTQKHLKEDDLNLNFKVYLDENVNAFALADGSIRVNSGMMDLMTDDELRSVIGHEIGHVKLGHSKTRTKTAYMTSAAKKAAVSRAAGEGAVTHLAASALAPMVEHFINAQYSQGQEEESDSYGLEFMKKNGYNKKASVSALMKLADGSEENASLFSSHPAPKDRAERLEEELE